jgi:hypothetical protein
MGATNAIPELLVHWALRQALDGVVCAFQTDYANLRRLAVDRAGYPHSNEDVTPPRKACGRLIGPRGI